MFGAVQYALLATSQEPSLSGKVAQEAQQPIDHCNRTFYRTSANLTTTYEVYDTVSCRRLTSTASLPKDRSAAVSTLGFTAVQIILGQHSESNGQTPYGR